MYLGRCFTSVTLSVVGAVKSLESSSVEYAMSGQISASQNSLPTIALYLLWSLAFSGWGTKFGLAMLPAVLTGFEFSIPNASNISFHARSGHSDVNAIAVVSQCPSQKVEGSLWSQFTFYIQKNLVWQLFSERLDTSRVSANKKIINVTQYIQFLGVMTVQVRISLAPLKAKRCHGLGKVRLPKCRCLLQSIHSSFQRPQAVILGIEFNRWSHEQSLNRRCVKECSGDVTSDHWPTAGQWQKEKDSDRRRRTRRVTRVGVDAKVSSVSISSWKHPCATNLQRTLCGVSLRITHLQSTALSMSSCEQCSSGFSSKTSKPLMNDISVIIPSFSSSSVNSGSTCIRHGSVRPGSCLISSVSSFVSTGITVSPTVTAETHAVNWVRSVSAPMACRWVSWMSSSDKSSSVWRFGLLIRSVAGSLTPFPSSGSDFSDSTSSATEGL